MSLKLIPALVAVTLILGGCASSSTTMNSEAPEKGDPDFLVARNSPGQLYINPDASEGGNAFREVFIAPLNLSQLQIIQPEGVPADEEWAMDDVEDGILQNAMTKEFANQLSFESAYNIVNRRSEADMIINTTVVAIHPYATKAESEAGAKKGGAITISMALVNAETGKVMIRSVDTKSTDDIWAFNQVSTEDDAANLIFRAWGNNMRRGLLQLQGRSNDPRDEALQMKQQ